jgi:23S rRNA pseudouridine2605 synthase
MPPRHAYWTILIDDQPTAFRAHDPEELLPTLNRLREKNASAVMKWFERGQLFDSRDAARASGLGQGERRWEGPRPERRDSRPPADERRGSAARPRDKNWRPGGEHRDPRQKYKDAKKAKWTRFKENIRARHDQRSARDPETFSPPHGDPLRDTYRERPSPRGDQRPPHDRRPPDDRRPSQNRPPSGDRRPPYDRRPFDDKRGFDDRRRHDDRGGVDRRRDAPREDRDGAPTRPHGDRFRDQRPRQPWSGRDDDRRRTDDRDRRFETRTPDRFERRDGPPRRDDQRHEWRPKPAGPRPRSSEGRFETRTPSGGRKKSFGAKPSGARPFGKKPFGKPPGARKPFGKKPFPGRRRDEDE